MLDIVRQKASRLCTSFYESVYFFWFCIGIYALGSWILWIGLQQSYKIAIMFSIIWIILYVGGSIAMYEVITEHDLDDYSIFKRVYIGAVISFTILVVVGGIRTLIFPIVLSVLPLGVSLFSAVLEGSYVHNHFHEYDLIWDVISNEKQNEFHRSVYFILHLMFHFMASYAIFAVAACVKVVKFTNYVTLGAVCIAVMILLFAWLVYDVKMRCLPIREALGGSISADVMHELGQIYPRGFDDNRIKFLLHDTLKQKGAAGFRKTPYNSPPTLYEKIKDEENHTNTIMTLFRVFPGIISTIYTPDDEGDIPFRLACQYASVEVVKHMVELDNDLLNIRDSKGNTVMHYSCQGNNYKVVNFLLNRHMILAITRNFYGNLPVYILCSNEQVVDKCCRQLFVKDALRSQHLETVMRLLLAYPEDMQEKLRAASPSKEKVAVLSTLALMELAVDSEDGDDHQSAPSPKPQKHLKLLAYIVLVLVNMTAAVYIGSLQSLSNTNQMKYDLEVKRLVDELIESQNEMNMLRSRMEVLKHASEGHSHSMLKAI